MGGTGTVAGFGFKAENQDLHPLSNFESIMQGVVTGEPVSCSPTKFGGVEMVLKINNPSNYDICDNVKYETDNVSFHRKNDVLNVHLYNKGFKDYAQKLLSEDSDRFDDLSVNLARIALKDIRADHIKREQSLKKKIELLFGS